MDATHVLGWQDGQMADGVPLLEAGTWYATVDGVRQCPNCKKWYRLRWDVALVEAAAPDESER